MAGERGDQPGGLADARRAARAPGPAELRELGQDDLAIGQEVAEEGQEGGRGGAQAVQEQPRLAARLAPAPDAHAPGADLEPLAPQPERTLGGGGQGAQGAREHGVDRRARSLQDLRRRR